jgi:rhodanese-related sulfurtransferase
MNGKEIASVLAIQLSVFFAASAAALADQCNSEAAGKSGCGAGACGLKPASVSAKAEYKAQTVCPVMGGKINKALYVDVKGHRVYLCCKGCEAAVKKNPEKYLAKIREKGEEPVKLAALKEGKCKTCAAGEFCSPCSRKKAARLVSSKGEKLEKAAVVNTPALAALIKSGVPLVVLDARNVKGDKARQLPGARQLSPKVSGKEAAEVIPTKSTLVVTYCGSVKCPASGHLAKRLEKLGYTNVVEYPQGIKGWTEAGQPVTSVK